MRYFYKKPEVYTVTYGETYSCNHPVYDRCTLYKRDGIGLAVIQQRCINKHTYWTEIDPWLINDIYLQPGFEKMFYEMARKPEDGLYPTITVRQLMWSIKMKPLMRERWETTFDHRYI